jgi:hypothetical protein
MQCRPQIMRCTVLTSLVRSLGVWLSSVAPARHLPHQLVPARPHSNLQAMAAAQRLRQTSYSDTKLIK